MADNTSLGSAESIRLYVYSRVLLVQALVAIFLCVNFLLIVTFSMKEYFYTSMRYILFANALVSDCVILIVTNIMMIMSFFHAAIQVWLCIIFFAMSSMYTFVTPFSLSAMTLERYVAICMPLQHAELCSTRRASHCIIIIQSISCITWIITLTIFSASVNVNVYRQHKICTAEIFFVHSWQGHIRSAISQFYFLVMFCTIVFSYMKIMKVARAASGEEKKSGGKGLKTVLLHAFQLLLCLIQLWSPFMEAAVIQINLMLYINVRYFNYITFYLLPRCLSPLIYGLRDEKFFLALKHYALCGMCKKKTLNFSV